MFDEQKDEELALYDKLFEKQSLYHEKWLKYQRLYNSKFEEKHFKELKKRRRSKIFVPVTRNTINIIKAIFATSFFSRGNPIEILPTSFNDEKDLIDDRNKVISYYYEKYKPSKELIKAFASALIFGMGIVITYWDEQKQKVITTNVPITDIAFDDECNSIDDIECIAYKSYDTIRSILQKIDSGFYNQKNLKNKLFSDEIQKSYIREEVKTIYIRDNAGWIVKTYIKNICVRVTHFKHLPFQFGYAISKLFDIDENIRKDEILCYGDCVPNLLEQLQYEINYKRNIKNDIQEKILNPDVYVADIAKVNPSDLVYGSGKRIRVQGDISGIKERSVPSEYSLNNDLGMLSGDVQSAIGVNSIQEGRTTASDRRSATAMSVINANSTMRIEEMIMLIKETLFEHWAKVWVDIVMKNASDDVINKITGKKYPLGRKGNRNSMEFDLKINFGITIDKQQKISEKLQALQMISQNPNINPSIIEELLKDVLKHIVGNDIDIENMFTKANENKQQSQQIDTEELQKELLANGVI